jgi:hypothetical protein
MYRISDLFSSVASKFRPGGGLAVSASLALAVSGFMAGPAAL